MGNENEKDLKIEASEINPAKSPSDTSSVNAHSAEDVQISWVPGLRQQFPWVGLAGFVCMALGTAIVVIVLTVSNGKRVAVWPTAGYPIAPNVLISLASSLSNLGLITAVSQGYALAWWRKALRGRKLESLHRDHLFSQSFLSVLTAGKHFNAIALAALMLKFAIIDSTLFQRSTKTGLVFKNGYQNATVTAFVTREWPQGVGGIPGTEGRLRTITEEFSSIIDTFNSKYASLKVHDTETIFGGCVPGQACVSTLEAMGFGFNCQLSVDDIDYGAWRLTNATAPPNNNGTVYPLWDINFDTIWPTAEKNYTSINLSMLYVDTHAGETGKNCPGTLTRRTCEIRPAIVEYPMNVLAADPKAAVDVTHLSFFNTNRTNVTFNMDLQTSQIDGITVMQYRDLVETMMDPSTVAALTFSLNNLFKSSANITWGKDWDLSVTGSRAQTEFYADNTNIIAEYCNYTVADRLDKDDATDPFIDLVRNINAFGFISSLYINGAPSVANATRRLGAGYEHQSLSMAVKGYVAVYQTNYSYMAGALVATLVTMLGVFPVYWGYWQLGRKVTLGPFEIANAFNAPIFSQAAHKDGDIEALIDEMGKTKVKYGQIVDEKTLKRGHLTMDESEKVVTPVKSEGNAAEVTKEEVAAKAGIGATIGGAITEAVLART